MEVDDQKSCDVNLPKDFGVLNFIEHRVKEISALTKAIEAPKPNGLVFQRLPVHMRRRVMGHTSKRMPRSVREAHIKQLEKSGFPPKPKRPSRRHRRRPKNLLSEYNRRQKSFVWLETHIWHAKRFHMIEKWGYKLALHCNDKSVRACYRAAAKHCLLQDMSYLVCIELQGNELTLLQELSHLCSPECGRTFAAKSLLAGRCEGQLMLYHQDKYPYEAIGQVSFMWKPPENVARRSIWVWSHPSYHKEVIAQFQSVFDLRLTEEVQQVVTGQGPEAEKLAVRIPPSVYRNDQSGVTMTVLKDVLGRFRLTGPLAHAVLQQALLPPPNLKMEQETLPKPTSMDIDDIFDAVIPSKPQTTSAVSTSNTAIPDGWGGSYYNNKSKTEEQRAQIQLWQSLGGVASPAQLPPHCVLGLTVQDPRIGSPYRRTKAQPNSESVPHLPALPAIVSNSPIWSHKIRALVTAEKKSDFEINRERSENLVPGWCVQESGLQGTLLPVLLIQSPGSQDKNIKKLGFGCGWDVIVPAGWSMPLLRSFVLQGARVGGLRELEAFGTEALVSCPPLSDPDTSAYKLEQEIRTQDAMDQHFRKPPNKRVNYMKLGIASPFGSPWLQLVQEWCPSKPDQFYILRDLSKLNNLKDALYGDTEYLGNDPNCLIKVTVILNKGGALSPWSVIALPEKLEDLTNPPQESTHVDTNESVRKELREKHQSRLRNLRRKRARSRRRDESVEQDNAEEIAKEFEQKMRVMWLPQPSNLKDHCDRKLAGFVTEGLYSNSEARAAGVGFMTEPALQALINTKSWNKKGEVLIRCTQNLHYKVAKMKIL